MSDTKLFAARPEHKAARNAMIQALESFPMLSAIELLAVAAQLVGSLIAFQDQRQFSSKEAMELVLLNIEEGNAVAIRETLGIPEGEA